MMMTNRSVSGMAEWVENQSCFDGRERKTTCRHQMLQIDHPRLQARWGKQGMKNRRPDEDEAVVPGEGSGRSHERKRRRRQD